MAATARRRDTEHRKNRVPEIGQWIELPVQTFFEKMVFYLDLRKRLPVIKSHADPKYGSLLDFPIEEKFHLLCSTKVILGRRNFS